MPSRINGLELARYRGFRDMQRASMSRLTLVYGVNNSGKSAVVRVPPLLASSRIPGRPGLNLETSVFRGAGFRDLAWRGALPSGDDPYLVLGVKLSSGTTWRWTFEWIDSKSMAVIRALEVESPGVREILERASTGNELPKDAEYDTPRGRTRVSFDGLIPREGAGEFVDQQRDALNEALDGVIWLSALRKGPPREGSPRGARGGLIGDGEGATPLAMADKQLRGNVSKWFLTHTGYYVEAEALGPDLERLVLRPSHNGHDVPFPDAGEGLQQVFPVITALEQLRQQGGFLTIEEPESHLHPRLQQALAEHIVEILTDQPKATVVLETHSEVFLLSALSAATQKLAGQVSLIWAELGADGAGDLEPIPLDDTGRPTTPRLEQAFATMGGMRRQLLEDRKARAGA